jgi:hypothetical protein
MLIFTTPTCKHCLKRLPDVRKFAASAGAGGPQVAVVVAGDFPDSLQREYLDALGGNVPIVVDFGGTLSSQWLINRFPFVLYVGPGGQLLNKGPLANPGSLEMLIQAPIEAAA